MSSGSTRSASTVRRRHRRTSAAVSQLRGRNLPCLPLTVDHSGHQTGGREPAPTGCRTGGRFPGPRRPSGTSPPTRRASLRWASSVATARGSARPWGPLPMTRLSLVHRYDSAPVAPIASLNRANPHRSRVSTTTFAVMGGLFRLPACSRTTAPHRVAAWWQSSSYCMSRLFVSQSPSVPCVPHVVMLTLSSPSAVPNT